MESKFQKLVFGFIFLIVVGAIWCTFFRKPETRLSFYLDQSRIATCYTNSVALNEVIDKRLAQYGRLRSDLNLNRYLTAIIGGLSLLLIASKSASIMIPWIGQ